MDVIHRHEHAAPFCGEHSENLRKPHDPTNEQKHMANIVKRWVVVRQRLHDGHRRDTNQDISLSEATLFFPNMAFRPCAPCHRKTLSCSRHRGQTERLSALPA